LYSLHLKSRKIYIVLTTKVCSTTAASPPAAAAIAARATAQKMVAAMESFSMLDFSENSVMCYSVVS
jgi:hypothetical protein